MCIIFSEASPNRKVNKLSQNKIKVNSAITLVFWSSKPKNTLLKCAKYGDTCKLLKQPETAIASEKWDGDDGKITHEGVGLPHV